MTDYKGVKIVLAFISSLDRIVETKMRVKSKAVSYKIIREVGDRLRTLFDNNWYKIWPCNLKKQYMVNFPNLLYGGNFKIKIKKDKRLMRA